MGPANPWSPNWRPDPTGRRHVAIRAARRGAVLAAALYLPVGAAAVVASGMPAEIGGPAVAVGLPGVALLGAGLAPAALGTQIDGIVVGAAMAIGAPVASVLSLLVGGVVVALVATIVGRDPGNLVGAIITESVSAAMGVLPLVVAASAVWILAVRRVSQPAP